MKRALFAIGSTVVALFMMLTYHPDSEKPPLPPIAQSTLQSGGTTPSSGSTAASSSLPRTTTGSTGLHQQTSSSTTIPRTTVSTPSSTTTASRSYTGSAADTQYGPVQVSITVSNGRITAVKPLQYPNNNSRDAQINSRAIPILQSETLQAQSADIQNVSGATYTSRGWKSSLQAALTAAGM